MKKLLFIATNSLLVACVQAQVSLPFYDAFSYGAGTNLAGYGNWVAGAGSGTIKVNAANLSYSGLATSTGNDVSLIPGSNAARTYVNFTAQTSDTLYFSFLLKVNAASSAQQLIGYSSNTTSSNSAPYLGLFVTSSGQLAVGISTSTPQFTGTGLTTNSTNLIVVGYTFGASDSAQVWVNPTSLGGSAPAATGSFTATGVHNSSLAYFHWNTPSAGAGGGSHEVDELRAGLTFAAVTPTNGTEPAVSAPYVTQTLVSGGALVLRGTNGTPNATYNVLASTNISAPANQWAEIGTNTFDSSGNFDCTNPISAGDAWRFYRLRVGDQSSPPPTAPSIDTQPQSQTVSVGQNATYSVSASGTTPLSYQWYFNTDTPLAGATDFSLTITNAGTNDAGGYSVIVTNVAGSVTSIVATLTVTGSVPPAPGITTQPQNLTVTEGQTPNFNVVATGTTPLRYQWYFNTNTMLADKTNATLTLINVSTNNAGGYSVIVTNGFGSVTSVVAMLTVNIPSTNPPDFSHVGFGNENFTATGAGSDAPSVIVTTGEELNNYSDSNTNIIIYVSGTLQISGMSTHVRANKTLIGMGNNAILEGGGLYLYKSTNVIIRNLTIRNSTEDDIGLHHSTNVWIDHCTFVDAADGELDITQESDKVTVSWCKFYYTDNPPAVNHRFVSLIGASNSDLGEYHTTYHHNWWSTNCIERMPSVRFGRVHAFNNYYDAPGNNYCVRSRLYAETLIEKNYFKNVQNPWEVFSNSTDPLGKVYATNNILSNVTWTGSTTNGMGEIRLTVPGNDPVFTPPYSYSLDAASAVPNLVTNYAGAGKITITP